MSDTPSRSALMTQHVQRLVSLSDELADYADTCGLVYMGTIHIMARQVAEQALVTLQYWRQIRQTLPQEPASSSQDIERQEEDP